MGDQTCTTSLQDQFDVHKSGCMQTGAISGEDSLYAACALLEKRLLVGHIVPACRAIAVLSISAAQKLQMMKLVLSI